MIGLEKGKVILSEYDINWPLEFENEKKSIQNTLTENEIRIEHIGSTSVENPGEKEQYAELKKVWLLNMLMIEKNILIPRQSLFKTY